MAQIRARLSAYRTNIVVLLLLAALIYQAWYLFPGVMADLARIRKDMGQPGLWRSANYSQNQKFANYIKFLNDNIPGDARVVLPWREDRDFCCGASSTPFMQFFLNPREVLNCLQPLDGCLEALSDERTYFLVVDPVSIERSEDRFAPAQVVPFDQSWSLIRPENPGEGLTTPLRAFNRAEEIVPALAFPAIWLATLVIPGLLLSQILMPNNGWAPKLASGYGLALGLFSFGLFVLLLVGFALSPAIIFTVNLVVLLPILLIYLTLAHQGRLPAFRKHFLPSANLADSFWLLVFALLSLLSTILSVGKGYHLVDSILLWGAKGYGIASHGLAAGASDWGTATLRYPLHIPLLIASFKVLFSEILPASKLVFPLYYLGLMVMLYSHLAARVPRTIAGLAALVLATAPILFLHSHVAYANIPFTFYSAGAVLILLDALHHGRDRPDNKGLFLAGLFFTFSAWTRPEGLSTSAPVILAIIIVSWKGGTRLNWRALAWSITPLAMFALFWPAVSGKVYLLTAREDNLILTAINQIMRGNLHLSEAGYILSYFGEQLFQKSSWGSMGICVALLAIMVIARRETRSASRSSLAGLIFILAIWAVYLVTSYDEVHDISWWVSTGLNRMAFPGITLIWAGLIESLKLPGPQPPGYE